MGSLAARNSPVASSTTTQAKMPSSAFQISLVSPSFCTGIACRHLTEAPHGESRRCICKCESVLAARSFLLDIISNYAGDAAI